MAPAPGPKGKFDSSGRFAKTPSSGGSRPTGTFEDEPKVSTPRSGRRPQGLTDEQRGTLDETEKHHAYGQPGGKVGRAQPDQRNTWGKALGGGGVASDGAGFVLGLIVYALGLNFIRGGWPAVAGWFGAKFINKPYTGPVSQVTPAPGGQSAAPDPAQ